VASVALVVVLAACGGTPSAAPSSTPAATTSRTPSSAASSTAPATALPLATLRARYLAIVTPANRVFAAFQPKLAALTVAVSASQLHAALRPVAAAVARSGRELYALRRSAPPRIAKAMYAVVSSDNTVWQGLEDLDQGWGSRSFDYSAWQGAFATAVRQADAAGSALRTALGLRPKVNGA